MMGSLDHDLWERTYDVAVLAELVAVQELTDTQLRGLLTALLAAPSPHVCVGVTDRDGVVRRATDGLLEGRDVSERPWFTAGLHGLAGNASADVELLLVDRNGVTGLGPPSMLAGRVSEQPSVVAAHEGRSGWAVEQWPDGRMLGAALSVRRSTRGLRALDRTEQAIRSGVTDTPLTIIQGTFATLATREREPTSDQRSNLVDACRRHIDHLGRLSSNLLLARALDPAAGAGSDHDGLHEGERFRIDDLHALSGADRLVDRVGTLDVVGQARLLDLVLDNLIDNARRYGSTPVEVVTHLVRDPETAVTGDDAGEMATLVAEVRDHGVGVPDEFVPALLDRFSQASVGTQRTASGTGIGLWLSRQLRSSVGGTINYDRSTDPTGGARFTVQLPVRLAPASSEALQGQMTIRA